MDFIKTWEEQLAFLEAQAKSLRDLINNQRAFMGQPIQESKSEVAKSPTTTTVTTTIQVDKKKPISEQLVDVFNDCNIALNNKSVNEAYDYASKTSGYNAYGELKKNKPKLFSIVKFNNDNQKVFWILSKWVKNGLLDERYRPKNISTGLPYEINPVEPPRNRAKNKSTRKKSA